MLASDKLIELGSVLEGAAAKEVVAALRVYVEDMRQDCNDCTTELLPQGVAPAVCAEARAYFAGGEQQLKELALALAQFQSGAWRQWPPVAAALEARREAVRPAR